MTITPMELYWITRLDNLQFVISILTVFSTIATIILGIMFVVVNNDDDFKDNLPITRKSFYTLLPITLIIMVAGVLVPTTKEAAAIIIIPKVVNSDFVQTKLPKEADALYELTKAWLMEKTEVPTCEKK